MATVWNPADILNVTLSSGNLLATANAGGQIGARAHGVGHSTGKWYLEYPTYISAGGGGAGLGLLSDTLGTGAATPPRLGMEASGGFNVPGANGGSLAGAFNGSPTGGLAADFDNGKAWFTIDGVNWIGWNGGGAAPNPVGNINGGSLAGLPGGLLYPLCAMFGTPSSCRLNVGASAFSYPVPSGFTAWDSLPVPTNIFGTVIN